MLQTVKPTSIVFLIVSVLLILGGIITCSIAEGAAAAEGVQLFPVYENGTSKLTVPLDKSSISKLNIVVADANVNIIGGAEESYIEVINYKPNYYTLTTTSKVLSFSEIPDLKTMVKFWETGFSFSGIRNIINTMRTTLGPKAVNIYLSNDHDVNQLNVTMENGALMISNIHTAGSFDITVAKGSVTIDSTTTTDVMLIHSDESTKIDISDTSAAEAKFSFNVADFTAENVIFTKAEITSESGTVNYMTDLQATAHNITTGGAVTLWGMDMPDGIAPADPTNGTYTFTLTIKSTSANVNITAPAAAEPTDEITE